MGDQMNMFFYLREVARHYGYGDVPLHITEGFYCGTGCGFYSRPEPERVQAEVYIQGYLRGLAMGIERLGASSEIWDAGSDYYYTGYGSVGVCHMGPELNPKPAFCAFGTMTRVLDRARFHSLTPTGSLVTHALRFDGPAGPIYAAWVIEGRRELSFAVSAGSRPQVTDSQGNRRAVEVTRGRATLELSPSPIYLEGAGVIAAFQAGEPHYPAAPAATAATILRRRQPGCVDARSAAV